MGLLCATWSATHRNSVLRLVGIRDIVGNCGSTRSHWASRLRCSSTDNKPDIHDTSWNEWSYLCCCWKFNWRPEPSTRVQVMEVDHSDRLVLLFRLEYTYNDLQRTNCSCIHLRWDYWWLNLSVYANRSDEIHTRFNIRSSTRNNTSTGKVEGSISDLSCSCIFGHNTSRLSTGILFQSWNQRSYTRLCVQQCFANSSVLKTDSCCFWLEKD